MSESVTAELRHAYTSGPLNVLRLALFSLFRPFRTGNLLRSGELVARGQAFNTLLVSSAVNAGIITLASFWIGVSLYGDDRLDSLAFFIAPIIAVVFYGIYFTLLRWLRVTKVPFSEFLRSGAVISTQAIVVAPLSLLPAIVATSVFFENGQLIEPIRQQILALPSNNILSMCGPELNSMVCRGALGGAANSTMWSVFVAQGIPLAIMFVNAIILKRSIGASYKGQLLAWAIFFAVTFIIGFIGGLIIAMS